MSNYGVRRYSPASSVGFGHAHCLLGAKLLLLPIASSAYAAANSDRLIASANEQLNPNQQLISPNGSYTLLNLVIIAPGNVPVDHVQRQTVRQHTLCSAVRHLGVNRA
jgi:hypothetical protein